MKQRMKLVIILTIGIVALAMLGGTWSKTFAQTVPTVPTVPTIPTIPNHHEQPGGPSPTQPAGPSPEEIAAKCNPSAVFVGPTKEGKAGCLPWEAFVPVGSACTDGYLNVLDHPIVSNDPPPDFWKMMNYGDGFETRFYVKGVRVFDPACANYNVRYYLQSWQLDTYNKTPDQLGIYYLDPNTNIWQDCNATLDTTLGANGALVCAIKSWGFFALGHPSTYNK